MKRTLIVGALAHVFAHATRDFAKAEADARALEFAPEVVKAPKPRSFAEQRMRDKQRKMEHKTRRR